MKITDCITTTGEIPMITGFEEIDSFLFVKEGGDFKPDKLMDDLAIIINTESGLVVILGCAHRGMINTLYHAQKLTGVNKVHTVLGGSHLISASEEQIGLTIKTLKELGVHGAMSLHWPSRGERPGAGVW